MRRVGLLFFLIIGLYLFTSAQQKEDKKDLPKIEEQILVTASKTPLLKSEATRSVLVLEREEIEALPVSTAEELLKFISGFDFQSRGAFGLQVDPSLRAGSFEQTLILIDGVKFTDPPDRAQYPEFTPNARRC
jgi:iron complex outermembrane receptor protein